MTVVNSIPNLSTKSTVSGAHKDLLGSRYSHAASNTDKYRRRTGELNCVETLS